MNAPANIRDKAAGPLLAEAIRIEVLIAAATQWRTAVLAQADANKAYSLCASLAEYETKQAIAALGFDDIHTELGDLASHIDETFGYDVAECARAAESYVPQVAA